MSNNNYNNCTCWRDISLTCAYICLFVVYFFRAIDHRDQLAREEGLSESMLERRDVMRQRYSICSHPRLQMLVVSDGYMVTILQLPGEPTCLSLMRGLCLEATQQLKKLRSANHTQAGLFGNSRSKQSSKQSVLNKRTSLVAGNEIAHRTQSHTEANSYRFEAEPEGLAYGGENESDAEGQGQGSPQINGLSHGRLDFGDVGNLATTLDYNALSVDEDMSAADRISTAQMALMQAWNLAASHVGLWTLEHEVVADNIADCLTQLFAVLLATDSKVLKDIGSTVARILRQSRENSPKKINKQLVLVLRLFKTILQTLRFDTHSRHLMVCSTKFTNSTVAMLLRNEHLSANEKRSRTLHGCYILLKYAEASLASIYSDVPHTQPYSNVKLYESPIEQNDQYQPAVFVYTAAPREGLDSMRNNGDVTAGSSEAVNGGLHVTENVGGVVSVQLTGVKRYMLWLS